jgi:hypothetical protein
MRFLARVTPAAAAFDQEKPIPEVKEAVASTHFIVAQANDRSASRTAQVSNRLNPATAVARVVHRPHATL